MSRDDLAGAAPALTQVAEILNAALPSWLETQRWFADKGRGIAGVEVEDALVERANGDVLILAIVCVAFRSGEDARYLLPLAWTRKPNEAAVIAEASLDGRAGALVESTDLPWFGRWLIDAMLSGNAGGDTWVFAPQPDAHERLEAARRVPAMVMRAEQSNTSLRFDDVLMTKLVRRLQAGPNPDEEMLRALAGIGFARVPPYVGGAAWRASDGRTYPIVLAQGFVPNLGDGWSWMLQRVADPSLADGLPSPGSDSPERLLGRRTGELHVALAGVAEPGLAPEPATVTTIAEDRHRVHDAVEQTISVLNEAANVLPPTLRQSLPATIGRLRDAAARAEGFTAEAATQRIRVHGDFHLGQTLRTPEQDWVIIDFEGEPARPVAERRQKSSALKDVAGMLRSFAYARGVAERGGGNPAALAAWESAARQAYLEGYRAAVRAAPLPLVPADEEAFMAALAAWELDKALYEVAYELRNRPDWVELPLRGLIDGT
jgi:trehalose synthase-fused probable maltokinase